MFQPDFTTSFLILIGVTCLYCAIVRWRRARTAPAAPLRKIEVVDPAAVHERFECLRSNAYAWMPDRDLTCLQSSRVSCDQVIVRREYEHANGFRLVEQSTVEADCVVHFIAFREPGGLEASEHYASVVFDRFRVFVGALLSEAERLHDRQGEISLLCPDGEWSPTLLPPSGRRNYA